LVAGLLAVGVAWILVTGLQARADLHAMRHDIGVLRSDLVAGRQRDARQELVRIQATARSAHDRTSGPAWWIGAQLPLLGSPLRTVRTISSVARTLSDGALPAVVTGGAALDPQELRVGAAQLDLARLQQAGPALERAAANLAAAVLRIAGTRGSWLGPVASGRSSALRELTSLEGTLRDTVLATRLLPPMLGGSGPRYYLVVFEGDNEARAIGGIFGGYGLLRADSGQMQFLRFGSDRDFTGLTAKIDLGSQFDKAYGGTDPYQGVADADLSPHFPDAARIWSSEAAARFGVQIDGVVAMDPVALARILRVIGPVGMPDGTMLTGENLVQTLDVSVYQRFDSGSVDVDTPERKAFFVTAAQAVTQAALDRTINTAMLLDALATSAGERRLLVYSAHPSEEQQLSTTPLAGVLARTKRSFAEVVVTNDSGTKLDYYLQRSLTYQRASCTASSATVTFRLRNAAPSSGLPAYLTTGKQWGDAAHPAGSEYLIVSLYSTQGSAVTGVTLDGQPLGTYSATDRGHPITETLVTIKPGQTLTEIFHVDEPAASGPVELPVQPLAHPLVVTADGPSC
jgi:hypothetical protein